MSIKWKRLNNAMQCARVGVFVLHVSRDKATHHHADGTKEPLVVWDWSVDRPNGWIASGTVATENAAKNSARRALKRHCEPRIKEAQAALFVLKGGQ